MKSKQLLLIGLAVILSTPCFAKGTHSKIYNQVVGLGITPGYYDLNKGSSTGCPFGDLEILDKGNYVSIKIGERTTLAPIGLENRNDDDGDLKATRSGRITGETIVVDSQISSDEDDVVGHSQQTLRRLSKTPNTNNSIRLEYTLDDQGKTHQGAPVYSTSLKCTLIKAN